MTTALNPDDDPATRVARYRSEYGLDAQITDHGRIVVRTSAPAMSAAFVYRPTSGSGLWPS